MVKLRSQNGTVIPIAVNPAPNTTILLVNAAGVVIGRVILNEQIVGPGSITVNAIHIILDSPLLGTTADIIVASAHSDIVCPVVTAASVGVSGQVLSSDQRPISRAIVTLTNSTGVVLTAITSPFGFFRFDEVPAGQTYIAEVSSKQYSFASQAIAVIDELTGVTFVAEP